VTDPQAEARYRTLEKYTRDLTRMAVEGKLDPVIGRDDEILRVIQILSRRTKNNPVLIGEAGVGKTAIVEGLAQKIASGDVPEILLGKRVISLDLSAMLAGSRFRAIEERLKATIEEVQRARRHHPVHRRSSPGGRRGSGAGRAGRREHDETGPGARGASVHRRNHAGRIPPVHREGQRARPAVRARVRRRAERRRNHRDALRPARPLRGAP
jgi:hypothetical protein